MRKAAAVLVCGIALILASCYYEDMNFSGGGASSVWWQGTPTIATTGVTVSAGMEELQPEPVDNLSASVDASRFGVTAFDRTYELETPADTDFSFNIVARGADNTGLTRIEIGHVEDDGKTPAVGVESIAAAGMTLEAPGVSNEGVTVQVNGDGFARATVRGRVSQGQVLLARVPLAGGEIELGIRISVGNTSAINLAAGNPYGFRPGMSTTDVYSSKALQFGLPAIAVSGDRYSLVTYDGDPNSSDYVTRRRKWLQMDAASGAVTGGSAESYSPDSGFWRDQDIAALGNVLTVAYTGHGKLRAEISLDRGATFPIEAEIDPYTGFGTRLVKIAIGTDYTIGVIYWKSQQGVSRLMLAEATPTGFNGNNDPSGFAWSAPVVVHNAMQDVSPLLMHAEYSEGGDLVIGYGYSKMSPMMTESIFRCAVRMWGSTSFDDKEIDRQTWVMPCDPHVSVMGSGSNMEIWYAYERDDGVLLWYSANGGLTYSLARHIATPGVMNPSVHARMQGGEKRVDLLYVAPSGWGLELHNEHWDDFTVGATPESWRVTQSDAVTGSSPAGMPPGYDITTLAWFGYDSVVMGDDVAIVLHELTYNSYEYYLAGGWQWMQPVLFGGGTATGGAGGSYTSSEPPDVLLPGMTGAVPTPDPDHRNQLRIAVID